MKINPDFKSLIPALTAEEYAQLEENIIEDGIREPLVVWHETGDLLDGHNRFEIAMKHGLAYKTIEMSFTDETACREWIIKNQFGRRNINSFQRAELALKLKPIIATQAKEQQGTRTDISQNSVKCIDTQRELAKVAGVSHDTISKVETIQQNADESVITQLRTGDISINKAYEDIKKPHVAYNSGNNEWYTPKDIIEAAREVLGRIDTDPASSDIANETVRASTYYTINDDGLNESWFGNVWLNPPYSTDLISKFIKKLDEEFAKGNIKTAIVLVNNATETTWFFTLVSGASAVCFPKGRIKFWSENGIGTAPLQGQAILYIGNDKEKFIQEFRSIGWCVEIVK